jgi:hypothetical protein
VVTAGLVAALVWSLLHVRHVHVPEGAALPTHQFSVAPSSAATAEPSATARPPGDTQADHLYIPSLGVNAQIVPQSAVVSGPTDHRTIELDSPPPRQVGRYTGGAPLSGSTGTVLIAGHINLDGVQGALWNLSRIQLGADIWVTDDEGKLSHWHVYANPAIAKDSPDWPVDVFDDQGPRRLVVASCTGQLHLVPGYGYSYDDNQFVYAVPAPIGT